MIKTFALELHFLMYIHSFGYLCYQRYINLWDPVDVGGQILLSLPRVPPQQDYILSCLFMSCKNHLLDCLLSFFWHHKPLCIADLSHETF